jgi:hypothetical protein
VQPDRWCRNRAFFEQLRLLLGVVGRSQIEIGRLTRRIQVSVDDPGVRAWFVGLLEISEVLQCPAK